MRQMLDRRSFLKLSLLAPSAFFPTNRFIQPHHASPSQPNILVILFDSLSARNMSLYGYSRHTCPNLERLAEQAIVYHNHHAPGNFTVPSTASFFTGLYPSRHTAYSMWSQAEPDSASNSLFPKLPAKYYSFAYTHNNFVNSLLSQVKDSIDEWKLTHELCLVSNDEADKCFASDYNTAAQFNEIGLWRPQLPTSSFFIARFSRLRLYLTINRLNRQYAAQFPRGVPNFTTIFFTLEQAMDWVIHQSREAPQPYFGYIHLMPPHSPYLTRAEFVDRFLDDYSPPEKPFHPFGKYDPAAIDQNRRTYDETIAYCDAEFARLFEALSSAGALENTILILTSDHGEMFERGIWEHDTPTLYEPILHIPLLIWKPGLNRRQDVYSHTSAVDLLPSLLAATRIQEASGSVNDTVQYPGKPLPGLGGEADPERIIFAVEAKENPRRAALKKATLAVYKGSYKLIVYRGYEQMLDSAELYDLETDPEELSNIAEKFPQVVQELQTAIEQQIG